MASLRRAPPGRERVGLTAAHIAGMARPERAVDIESSKPVCSYCDSPECWSGEDCCAGAVSGLDLMVLCHAEPSDLSKPQARLGLSVDKVRTL